MDTVEELTGDEDGVWRVTTVGSCHIINFQRRTVTRIRGVGRNPSINDRERPLRSIESCKVGEVGRWTMQSDDFFTAYFWHQTSTVQRIERLTGMELGNANTEVALENINASDGLLSTADVAALLDVSVDMVQELFDSDRLLGLIWKERLVFPGCQFGPEQNEVAAFVQPLIAAAYELNYSVRSLIFWLYSPTTYFDGARPVNYTDEPERLVEAFRNGAGIEW
ncbi:hypothetical protein ASC66_08130 [Leifsonia sp. Root4]|uniref:hypothetical protein n=1 Tax=Leifsonia sp. Root4 TaxID=1736525 RepID=UPI0006F5A2BD|nr:hypothetical protein [Leifsonia sp. Root4]KQW06445.1 hypothetical protein ASC66_08130 [Leifsonia sp. Root4]